MSGKRDMFKILNAWMGNQASLTTVLHHTGARASRMAAQIRLRFSHFRNLASIDAARQSCAATDLTVTLTARKACQ
jgi:hypothetical protein